MVDFQPPAGYAAACAPVTSPSLRTALADRPVVLLHGARQTGKTMLVRAVAEDSGARYATLDDLTMLSAARSDPAGFLAGFAQPLVLERSAARARPAARHQGEPWIASAPRGRFLLTGSANVLLLPNGIAGGLLRERRESVTGPAAESERG